MAAIKVFQRYEKKFLMDRETMERMLVEIRRHMVPDKFCEDGKTYHICNLYYDTDQNDVIRESLQKPFYKEKFRIRSYGVPSGETDPVFLEMKKKINHMVTKRRATLTLAQTRTFLKDRQVPDDADYMTRQVLREIAFYLSQNDVRPSTRISYDRTAFFDREDRQFRLTFDQNLRHIRGNVYLETPEEGPLLMPEDFRLMEVKVSRAYPFWLARLMSREEVRPASFSKYGVAYKTWLAKEILQDHSVNVLAHI